MVSRVMLSVLAVLLLVDAAKAKSTNSTIIPCVFKEVATCYNFMPDMGGNMIHKFAASQQEVSLSCMNMLYFKPCLESLNKKCGKKVNLNKTMTNILTFANELCFDPKTSAMFVNASRNCYNTHFANITYCGTRYGAHGKNDSKSLCKANKDTEKCIRNVIGTCKNSSSRYILNKVITTYNAYRPLLCGSSGLHSTSLWILGTLYIIVGSFFLN